MTKYQLLLTTALLIFPGFIQAWTANAALVAGQETQADDFIQDGTIKAASGGIAAAAKPPRLDPGRQG